MTLRSALEDFEANTLGAVPGLLGKLSYTSSLHDGSGAYRHWGLEKIHGADAAQRAIGSAHRMLLSRVLKAPLPVLLDDLQTSCAGEQRTETEFLFGLTERPSLPKPISPAAPGHLRSVLHALSALLENRRVASPRGA
jgi:hypothetical protein